MCSKPIEDSTAISAQGLTKSYRIWRDPSDRIFSAFWAYLAKVLPGSAGTALLKKSTAAYHDFFAISDINFEVKRGEAVGIIGRNGAGKSTLLQIIAGTLQPSSGSISIKGRVAALLELGAGFNPEFTGRENILLTGAIIGLTKQEMMARFDEIAQFADIGEFIEQPIKTYSSGMMVRLAFAVQTAIEPDILIIDEALSVGDIFFQQKCATRMRELQDQGTTLLFVSHDLATVRDLCERTLYLKKGKGVFFGETQMAITQYYEEVNDQAPSSVKTPILGTKTLDMSVLSNFMSQTHWRTDSSESGTDRPAQLVGIAVLNEQRVPDTSIKMGQTLYFQILFKAVESGSYHIVIELKNRHDQVVTSISSYTSGLEPHSLNAGEAAIFEIGITFNLEAGRYTCQGVISTDSKMPNRGVRIDSSPWIGPISVNWEYDKHPAPFLGMFGPPSQARFLNCNSE